MYESGPRSHRTAAPGHFLQPDENLGFGGGNNYGASKAGGDVLAFINSNAFVDPLALSRLATQARRPDVGIASASLKLADEPDLMKSAGNPLQFLGFSWAGGFREPVANHQVERTVASATGTAMALRRELFERRGGFAPNYTAYWEDLEISIRCWQVGLKVIYVPDAVVFHHYDFARNAQKYYLTERNRLMFVFTVFARRTLLLMAPVLVLSEVGLLMVAITQGWWRQKIAGWRWLTRDRRRVLSRRKHLQAERTVPDRALIDLFKPVSIRTTYRFHATRN